MSDKKELKEREVNRNEESADRPETPQPLSVKQIVDAYPNDRQKAIDYVMMGIQTDMNRIANSIEYLARRAQIQDPIPGLDTSPADPKKPT